MGDPIDVTSLANEVANGNFDDARLNKRLANIIERVAVEPGKSFPRVFSSAELEGAYRFFSNTHVTPEEILAPHVDAVRARCVDAKRVLVVHDSTDFSFRVDGERQNLGRARTSNQTFYAHASLALSADGSRKPLGVAELKTWTRGPGRNLKEKERDRWRRQALSVAATLGRDAHVIHVMDREADHYALYAELSQNDVRFVVRGYIDRWVQSDSDGPRAKLNEVLSTITRQVIREAPLTKRAPKRSPTKAKTHPARGARDAKLSVGATTIVMPRPKDHRKGSGPDSIRMNVVRVWEEQPPEGEPAVEWILLTNEPIDTPNDVLAIVDHYRARWTIEEFFKALKTGCSFERRQLQDYESLINLLATFAPIAYQALLLRTQARVEPNAPASSVLSADELEVLRELGRRKLPDAPTARDALLAVAALGGHIQYAPDPGWLTISRGYEKLALLTEGWRAAKFRSASDQR